MYDTRGETKFEFDEVNWFSLYFSSMVVVVLIVWWGVDGYLVFLLHGYGGAGCVVRC